MTFYNNGIFYELIKGNDASNNLVFIHGSGCNRLFLRALAKQLPDYNCYLPDLPDHGNSEFCNCRTAEDYVESVVSFVSKLENVTLIGHSLGGTICLGVAAKNLPCVTKCVIISSGAKFDKLDKKIHTMVADKKVNWIHLLKCLGSLHCPSVLLDLLTFENPEIILKDFYIDCRLDLEYTLQSIHIPTMIMVGMDDILTIPEYSVNIHRAIEGSRLVYFPRCRHMLPIARKKQVAELIRDFV